MFSHRGKRIKFPKESIRSWLAWLAGNMTQSDFMLDGIQPNWLPTKRMQRFYWMAVALISLLPVVLFAWLLALTTLYVFYAKNEIPDKFAYQMFFTGPFFVFSAALTVWLLLRHQFGSRIFFLPAIFLGFSIALGLQIEAGWPFALFAGSILGSISGLGLFWFGKRQTEEQNVPFHDIETVEIKEFSRSKFLLGLLYGSGFGVIVGMAISVTILLSNVQTELPFWTFLFRVGGLPEFWDYIKWSWAILGNSVVGMCTVFFGILLGTVGGSVAIDQKAQPNLRIWQSGKNGLRIGGLVTLGILVQIFLIRDPMNAGQVENWHFWARAFIIDIGLLVGTILGLYYGGFAFIQHFVLRFFIWRERWLPWDMPQFLEDSVHLIFLRKVGYGHIFIHRYLQEYFVSKKWDNEN